ncbi:MAG: cyanophycin synthetase [Bacteroidota bacterium]
MSIESIALQGTRSQKTLAASLHSRLLDVRKDRIRESLFDFNNEAHRLEFVTTVRGIDFINDSKATKVNATWFGLESMNRPVIWIVGGVETNTDFSQLRDIVKEKVKTIICLGKDKHTIVEAFSDIIDDISESESMDEVVLRAYYRANKGDIVLLSPACASFDMYENYEARGEAFKRAVAEL